MSRNLGLRINDRIEKDIIPFLSRNFLWDDKNNCPGRTLIILDLVEKKEDITEKYFDKNSCEYISFYYWHFTKKGKDFICKLIQNIY